MNNQNFAELLKSARTAAGISQKKLANQIGVFQPMISCWEKNTIPCNDNLIGICQVLGLDVDTAIAAIAVSTNQNTGRIKRHILDRVCYCSRGKFSSTSALMTVCIDRKKKGDARCRECMVLKTFGKDEDVLRECNITIMGRE